MKEKVLKAIEILKKEYNNGGYTLEEYVDLLNALNSTVWNIDRFLLSTEIIPLEIQNIIHAEIKKA